MLPRDFLEFATDCVSTFNYEAGQRSAISRAYYAAFHACEVAIAANGWHYELGHGKHEQVIRTIAREFPEDYDKIQWLWNLKQLREQADYQLSQPVRIKRPLDAVIRAGRFMDWLESNS